MRAGSTCGRERTSPWPGPSPPQRSSRGYVRRFFGRRMPGSISVITAEESTMARVFYVTIEGSRQGRFKGESTLANAKGKIEGLTFSSEVASPRDVATGQASGKRIHSPITFTKQWGAASPQLFQAAVTNEILKSVLFEFVGTDKAGKELVFE